MSGGTTATAKTASCWTIIPSCRCRPSKSTARILGGWEFDNWLLMRPEGFARGLKNVEVSYRAGYERMPADIREAVMIIAVQRVNEIEGKGVRSKTLAGETVAFSTFGNSGGMPPSAFAILNEYKRKGV